MTLILINDTHCWICGTTTNTTGHHALPQHLNPKQNVVIPICRTCHDKLNNDDTMGMYSYLHKLTKQLEDANRNISVIQKLLDENNKLKAVKTGTKVVL
jgi:5-methylcytosine-specific restriction endonuclease McrA